MTPEYMKIVQGTVEGMVAESMVHEKRHTGWTLVLGWLAMIALSAAFSYFDLNGISAAIFYVAPILLGATYLIEANAINFAASKIWEERPTNERVMITATLIAIGSDWQSDVDEAKAKTP